jgi:DNA-binding MurR/RpiR family transcriptional regulator
MAAVTYAELARDLAARFDSLSPQLRKAARYLMDAPADVAVYSMREVARRADVPPGTLVRLSAVLGFAGYNALRDVHRSGVLHSRRDAPFSGPARDLQRAARSSTATQIMGTVHAAEIENLRETFANNDAAVMERAVRLIESARTIYVLGQRSCFPAAFFFNYVFRLFRPGAFLVDGHGSAFVDDLRGIGPKDLLIAISIQPYTAEVVRAAQFARAEGARVLLITDSRASPFRNLATETLLAATRSASFFHSVLSLLALIQVLIAMLASRGGDKALAAIAKSERQLDWFKTYWEREGGPVDA